MEDIKYSFSCPTAAQGRNEPINEGMLRFLESFDPINRKYNLSSFPLTFGAHAIASQYEDSLQFGNLTKHKFSNIVDNLKLVYWEPKIIEKDIRAYYLVEQNYW